jgi:hypothetical protein
MQYAGWRSSKLLEFIAKSVPNHHEDELNLAGVVHCASRFTCQIVMTGNVSSNCDVY